MTLIELHRCFLNVFKRVGVDAKEVEIIFSMVGDRQELITAALIWSDEGEVCSHSHTFTTHELNQFAGDHGVILDGLITEYKYAKSKAKKVCE